MSRKDFSTVTIPKDVYDELRDYCKKHSYNMSGLVSKLITEHIPKVVKGEIKVENVNDNLQNNKYNK